MTRKKSINDNNVNDVGKDKGDENQPKVCLMTAEQDPMPIKETDVDDVEPDADAEQQPMNGGKNKEKKKKARFAPMAILEQWFLGK